MKKLTTVQLLLGSAITTALLWIYYTEQQRGTPVALCVAIMQPRVEMAADLPEGADRFAALAASAVEAGARDSVWTLERVYAVEASDIRAVASDDPLQVCNATGADEVIESIVHAAKDGYTVRMVRHARDGSLRWSSSYHAATHRDVGLLAVEHLRDAYDGRKTDRLGAGITHEDYLEYVQIRERLRRPEGDWLPAAIQDLEALRKSSPDLVGAAALEAKISAYLYRQSREQRYLDHGNRALKALEEVAERAQYLQAEVSMAIAINDLNRAEIALRDLEEEAPEHPYLLGFEARLAVARGDGQHAIHLLEEAVERRPSLNLLRFLADTEKQFGRMVKAREHLEQAQALDPGNISVVKQLGDVALDTCELESAVALFQKACALNPQPFWIMQLGTALLLNGDYQEALEVYDAIEDPQHPLILTNIADAHLAAGESEMAFDYYKRALDASKDHATPKEQALSGYLHSQLGDINNATKEVEEAYSRAPESPYVAYWAASVHKRAGNGKAADEMMTRAKDLGLGPCWFVPPWF